LRRARVDLVGTTVNLKRGLELVMGPMEWEIAASPSGARAEGRGSVAGVSISWLPEADGERFEVKAAEAPVGRVLAVNYRGATVDFGVLDGTIQAERRRSETTFDAEVLSRGVRIPSLAREGRAALSEPTDVALSLAGSWRPAQDALVLSRWSLKTDEGVASGTLDVAQARKDPRTDLSVEMDRVDFGRLLRVLRVDQPDAPGSPLQSDLGSGFLSGHFSGRVADPASFAVSYRLDFTPPARIPPAILKLRGDFVQQVHTSYGPRDIVVSPSSPDFVALRDVAPLFVHTLLIAEDAAFFSHRGIDLAEVPSAVLRNWSGSGATRGASTITQQLAKNLFLSREKRLGRKLQELPLALLLESALGKERILEIYLNVIEWGPGLYGLRPAARSYFRKEPGSLTPRQIAFLVALIPGPVLYQSAIATGTPSQGFRPLIDDLLAKLRSVGDLTEDEYQAAMSEELSIDGPLRTRAGEGPSADDP
jgi:hypothetical protein